MRESVFEGAFVEPKTIFVENTTVMFLSALVIASRSQEDTISRDDDQIQQDFNVI